MMKKTDITLLDRIGLARPGIDAHTLGLMSVEQLLRDCGVECIVADARVCGALDAPEDPTRMEEICLWLKKNRISVLGFSYRLDPGDGAERCGRLVYELEKRRLMQSAGGPLKAVYFAGLPRTCRLVSTQCPAVAGTFSGDETPAETLEKFGLESRALPQTLAGGIAYDDARLAFGKDLVRKGDYLTVTPVDRRSYPGFGTRSDTLLARLSHGVANHLPPLMRAHVGPYLTDRDEALRLFFHWCQQLAGTGLLDVLSIGTSQLSQSNFGEDWGDSPNGGGVPINSNSEFAAAWQVSRPMLVRAYAGTKDIPALAKMYEETIDMAWHALSLWWFCKSDGRGPYSVAENLEQHLNTLRFIASTGKPFEANVPHHFAFRGADDVTYVVSAVIAAKVAKAQGIQHFILQNMLNTPKYTWGVQDLAKSRAMLQLVRELEDDRFRVILQPRGGLDYFSHDPDKAKAQLAAATALMDDIEPDNPASPPVIHVVSYSEGSNLADPPTINESIQITRHALVEYRKLRQKGEIDNKNGDPDVAARTAELLSDVRTVIRAIEASVSDPYSAGGLYRIIQQGFLPVPYLWECREEFTFARKWQTRLVHGGVKVVDDKGVPISVADRMSMVREANSAHPGALTQM